MIRSFRRKIESVNAIQFIEDSKCIYNISRWVGGVEVDYSDIKNPKLIIIKNNTVASVGDFIAMDDTGYFYTISSDEFLEAYDEVK